MCGEIACFEINIVDRKFTNEDHDKNNIIGNLDIKFYSCRDHKYKIELQPEDKIKNICAQ